MSRGPVATVVVGNPKVGSRTAVAAATVARRVLSEGGFPAGDDAIDMVELAPLGPNLFGWGDADVAAAKASVLASRLVVFASPTYKASYTGLLKAFLDQFDRDELQGVPTVPVMIGASPIHHLAVEHQLRPVLVEIGASCPTRGLFILEQELASLDDQLERWLVVAKRPLLACIAAWSAPHRGDTNG